MREIIANFLFRYLHIYMLLPRLPLGYWGRDHNVYIAHGPPSNNHKSLTSWRTQEVLNK